MTPRLLYLGDVPVESSYHGSTLLYRLLQGYPADRLTIVEGNLFPARTDRRLPGVTHHTLQVGKSRALNTRFHDSYSRWLSMGAGLIEKYDVRPEDLDGIVEHARSIAGTKMALFFRDLGHGKVKISFRSTGKVDVNAFAREFGGGGHAKAAGAMLPGTLDAVRDQVIAAARNYLASPHG